MSDRWREYEPSIPIAVQGGIKLANPKRVEASWWAAEWLEALVRCGMGTRLSRGRRYAAKGQVLDLQIEPGLIVARVQGSRKTPYRIQIAAPVLDSAGCQQIAASLSEQVGYGAQLLSGVLPQELPQLFEQAGSWLFPPNYRVFAASCSCPDWANPCKHLAAVFMLLAQEFDRDPFLLLKFRGLERDQLLLGLGIGSSGPSPERQPEPVGSAGQPVNPEAFWSGSRAADSPAEAGEAAHGPTFYLQQVGRFPFWRGEQPLLAALQPVYQHAAERIAADLFPAMDQQEDPDCEC
jgi:uncharacterized Zn finger protein